MDDLHLTLKNVDVDFTIYGIQSRSIKSEFLRVSTGGLISVSSDARVVIKALSGISLDIRHGDRVGLLGHNGAGKTTLLRVLAGVYEPVRGTIERTGNVSTLFDLTCGFDSEASGYENILIRGMYLGLDREQIMERYEDIASFSELGGYLYMPVRTYSVGMLMRLAFAISTAATREILLMDEWLAVGDAGFVPKAEQRLLKLIGSTGILVIASHSLAILERVCNRLIWLDAGKIRADGSPSTVKAAFIAANAA
jgi:lipopolysaccharide transport system ATP-binding protein